MIYLGVALMVYNIWQYAHFVRRIRGHGDWKQARHILVIPIALLVLFLIGYLAVALFVKPSLIVSAILLGGSVYVAIMGWLIQRIADRIRENERLEARAVAAEEASTAKTRFLSNMSHDIRTPLNAIIGYTALAKNAPDEAQREYVHKIENAGQQMLTLVNEVLEMSRIESGKLELEPTNTDLVETIQQIGDLMHAQMEEKQIAFTVNCHVEDRWVVCDGQRLSRALLNIVGNAQKFTDPGGQVCLLLEQTGRQGDTASYEIRVRDNGIGMSPEFAERIFTPFERERTSTVSRIQGTGLGMSISKNIVDMMGGRIAVDTKVGEGTEFTLSLSFPLGIVPEGSAEPEQRKRVLEGARLLLAEDNDVNREIAVMLLTQNGMTVDCVENGAEAVSRLAASMPGAYDAVLMDIQMPVMGGYEAARKIRGLPDRALANIPIIAMTANAFSEDVETARAAGMQAHIAKPLDVQKMLETLSDVLSAATPTRFSDS